MARDSTTTPTTAPGVVVDANGDLTATPGSGVTTWQRVLYIAIFVGMWALLAFPLIYDIVVVTSHYVVTFTPHAQNQDIILETTLHPDYYWNNVYNHNMMADELAEAEWNTWTIWNTAKLVVSGCVFGFYIYIFAAVIIGSIEGLGKYDSKTSLLNEPANMWIFFALNSIYLVSASCKFALVMISLEKF